MGPTYRVVSSDSGRLSSASAEDTKVRRRGGRRRIFVDNAHVLCVMCRVCVFSKIRSLSLRKCRGGNVTNALVVCAQFGAKCRWMGTTTDPAVDNDAAFVYADLAKFGVDCSFATTVMPGAMPVSYIFSSRATGSRTIIHHRDLPELSASSFLEKLTSLPECNKRPRWFHFEGRNMENVHEMMKFVRQHIPDAKISLEVEASRNEWEAAKPLIELADFVFISKDYVRKKLGFRDAHEFFESLNTVTSQNRAYICPWGHEGVQGILSSVLRLRHYLVVSGLIPLSLRLVASLRQSACSKVSNLTSR
ncbi:hypothetical protein PINS_up002774 [Pythium insidiosum]|nr:hypothetical protein PINS_up002774 [Pythium insidiosum]